MKDLFKRTIRPGDHGSEAEGHQDNNQPEQHGHLPKFAWNKARPAADSGNPEGKDHERNGADTQADIPDNLWTRCPACKELIYTKELENNKRVCQKCNHHFRLGAYERIAQLVDEGSFEEMDRNLITADPLNFVNLAEPPYTKKMAATRAKTKLNEALVTGFGTIEGFSIGLAICDFSFQGGSMGSVLGEKLVRLVEAAIKRKTAVLTVSASGGARMHEGLFSLMQMAKTTASLNRLGEAGLPHFSLLTDPTTGGVFASYASVADIIMAEPGALIGFAGPRVIEQITKQKLPPGFQTAEFLLEHGMVDLVLPRRELVTTLVTLLKLYCKPQRAPLPERTLEVVNARQ